MAKALLRRQRHCGGFGIFDLVNNPIFQFALSVFIAFWTARAAVARGRSPWLWGGVALIFGLLSIEDSLRGLSFASVAPVLYLMLFVRPKERRPMRPQRNACPKCAAPHSPQQNYCTKCGWELSREYAPENSDTVLASEMRQPSTTPERDTATVYDGASGGNAVRIRAVGHGNARGTARRRRSPPPPNARRMRLRSRRPNRPLPMPSRNRSRGLGGSPSRGRRPPRNR